MIWRGEPERASSWIPEKPERIKTIYKQLVDEGLADRCHRLESRDATREELQWLHDPEHLDKMEASTKMERTELNELEVHYDIKDIYLCPETQKAALLAAGSALQVVDSILTGRSRSGVAVIRPPGHHAEGDKAYGFCIYNNTALAAKYAIEVHHLERFETFPRRTGLYLVNTINALICAEFSSSTGTFTMATGSRKCFKTIPEFFTFLFIAWILSLGSWKTWTVLSLAPVPEPATMSTSAGPR